jgi:hypothetical protein
MPMKKRRPRVARDRRQDGAEQLAVGQQRRGDVDRIGRRREPGRIVFSSAWVSAESGCSGMPATLAASAVSTQTAPELLIATRRRPRGFQP